jgi:hypothetical protein
VSLERRGPEVANRDGLAVVVEWLPQDRPRLVVGGDEDAPQVDGLESVAAHHGCAGVGLELVEGGVDAAGEFDPQGIVEQRL